MKQVRKINKMAAKLGFTLIELSIVLVIIGLIVGGILVGQDLIKAAEIRATVSQLEKYSTAVNTFRGKYNGLPGDLLNATNFGFEARTQAGTGDGDAQIESAAGTAGSYAGETSCFWDDLSTIGLIAEALNGSTVCGASHAVTPVGNGLPGAKLGRGNFIIVGSLAGVNYWVLTGVSAVNATGDYALTRLLTPAEAYQIDSKLDDGAPTSGGVITVRDAVNGVFATVETPATPAATGVCTVANNTYNFSTEGGNEQSCQIRLRTFF